MLLNNYEIALFAETQTYPDSYREKITGYTI